MRASGLGKVVEYFRGPLPGEEIDGFTERAGVATRIYGVETLEAECNNLHLWHHLFRGLALGDAPDLTAAKTLPGSA